MNLIFNFLVLIGVLARITFFETLRPLERRVLFSLFFFLVFLDENPFCLSFLSLKIPQKQNVKQRLFTYVLWKFFFVCTVLEPGVPELFLWLVWFGVLAFLHIFAMLARDRYDYVCYCSLLFNVEYTYIIV